MTHAPRDSDPPASPLLAWLGDVASRAQGGAAALLLAALGHVLNQQAWARDKLRMHAGRTLRVGVESAAGRPGPQVFASITPEGLLVAADDADEADPPAATLMLSASPRALVALLGEGPEGVMRHLRIDGDAMLVATVGELARHLRWDAEEDLSKLVGDIAAHRIAGVTGKGARYLFDLGARAQSTLARFAGSGAVPIVAAGQAQWLREGAQELERQVGHLESRIAALRAAR